MDSALGDLGAGEKKSFHSGGKEGGGEAMLPLETFFGKAKPEEPKLTFGKQGQPQKSPPHPSAVSGKRKDAGCLTIATHTDTHTHTTCTSQRKVPEDGRGWDGVDPHLA